MLVFERFTKKWSNILLVAILTVCNSFCCYAAAYAAVRNKGSPKWNFKKLSLIHIFKKVWKKKPNLSKHYHYTAYQKVIQINIILFWEKSFLSKHIAKDIEKKYITSALTKKAHNRYKNKTKKSKNINMFTVLNNNYQITFSFCDENIWISFLRNFNNMHKNFFHLRNNRLKLVSVVIF